MKNVTTLLFTFLLCIVQLCVAEPVQTTDEFIDGLVVTYQQRCKAESADPNLDIMGKILCKCIPAKLVELQSSLSRGELDMRWSETEFTNIYFKDQVLGECGGQIFSAIYGEGCAKRFSEKKVNSEAFCQCMSREFKDFSSPELVQLGVESSQYNQSAAEAKKQGIAVPEPPPLYRRYMEKDAICSK